MTVEDATATPAEPLPLRKNRDFQILWTGQAVSVLGTTVTQIAYPLLILAMTGSATQAGLLATVELVVFLLATLPAGVIADRFNRRVIMIGCDLGRAVVLGSVVVLLASGRAQVWMIVVAAGLSSIGDALFAPSSNGATKQLVPASQLSTAVAAREGRGAVAAMVGPPLGGWLFTLGRSVPFLFDMVTYLAGAVSLLFIRKPFQRERGAEHAEPLWRGATKGFVFVLRQPILRAILTWSVIVNLAFAGIPVVLIANATDRGAPKSVVGLMITLVGLGMLAGALLSPRILKLVRPSPLVYYTAISLPIGLLALVFIPWPLAIGAVTGFITATIPPMNSLLGGYLGAMVPDELQGRVAAATMLSSMALRPIGPLVLGIVYDAHGAGWAFAAAALVAAVAAMATLDKDLRHMRRPEELAVE